MYIRMAVLLMVSLYTGRVVYNALGVENYGTYNVVASLVVFLVFINNGLGAATRRFITAAITNKDEDMDKITFKAALKAHFYISFVVILIAETLGLWFTNNYLNIPDDTMYAVNVVYQISILSSVILILQTPFSSVIISFEKMSIYAYISSVDVLFKLLMAFLINVLPGDKLINYSLLLFFSSFVSFIIYLFYCYKSFPMCRLTRKSDNKLMLEMFKYMGWSTIGQGTVVLANQGVTLIVNNFCGVIANAAIGVSNYITNIVTNFVTNFQIAFNPQITKSYISKDYSNLTPFIYNTSRYSGYLVLTFLLPVCFASDPFLKIWLGNYPIYSVEFCNYSMVYIYLEAITAPLWMVLSSDKDIKLYQIVVSLIFLLNVLFSWCLLSLGTIPYIVIIVKIVVDALLIFARLCFVKRRIVNFSITEWTIKSVIIPFALTFMAAVAPFLIFYYFKSNNLLLVFLVRSIISLISILVFIYFVGLYRNEKYFIVSKIKYVLNYDKI